MSPSMRKPLKIALAAAVAFGTLFVNEKFAQIENGAFVSQASAWIGRPLTPFSYAGVARRTTRRAYGYGAAGVYGAPVYGAPLIYGAPVYGAPVYGAPYASGCYQVVGPYGGLITRCP